jgi:arylsulfatase A-like enzyme
MDRVDDEPFFLFVNAMDAHEPHRTVRGYRTTNVPSGWNSEHLSNADVIRDPDAHAADVRRYRTQYAASIDYLDRWAAAFIDELRAATERETTVVITADHGENLAYPADDRLFGHVGSLSEGVLHVPLCVVNPPRDRGTVSDYVSHLDLRRLLAGLAEGTLPDITRKRAVAELAGPTPGNDSLAADRWRRLRRCAYDGTAKWTWDESGAVRRIDLERGRPSWQREVSGDATIPEWARSSSADGPFTVSTAEAATAVRSNASDGPAATAAGESEPVDPDVTDRLRELGYR